MSTTSHNPNEGNVPPAGVPRRQSLTNAEYAGGSFLGSQPPSRSILRGGSCGCGHAEGSDDDLHNAEINRHLWNCVHGSLSLAKKKILRIVQNEEDAEDALGKDGSQFFATLVKFSCMLKIETTRASSGNT
jgi:hypothetical protein